MKNDLNVNPKRGTDGMNPQKENCWMKRLWTQGFCSKARPAVSPSGIYPLCGHYIKGACPKLPPVFTILQTDGPPGIDPSQFRKQTCPQVLMLKGSSNLPKADGLVRGTAGSHPGLALKPTCFTTRSPASVKWGSCYPPPHVFISV